MGFFSSFKGQIGRDTGKVVSNLVWGDKHASVYRRAQSRYSTKKQEEKEEAEFERLVQEQKIEKAQEVVDKGIAKVISMKIPQKKELIIEMLQELTVMLIANPWGSVYKSIAKHPNYFRIRQLIIEHLQNFDGKMETAEEWKKLNDFRFNLIELYNLK